MRISKNTGDASDSMNRFNLKKLRQELEGRKTDNIYRSCPEVLSRNGTRITVGDREYVNFSSNDYLGMAMSGNLSEAWQRGLQIWKCGSGASPLVTGLTAAHVSLQNFICEYLGVEAVILFSSGFAANQAVIKSFCPSGTTIYADRLSHASLQEAASMTGARLNRFLHNDPASLKRYLEKGGTGLIVTEGVFSMDGDEAPLAEIIELADTYGIPVLLDDAHGFGVHGHQGRGTVSAQGLRHSDFDVVTGTFGKAFGTGGAFVAGSRTIIDYMINFAREYIYSTHMPPAQAYATEFSMRYVSEHEELREILRDNVTLFKSLMAETNCRLVNSENSIQPLILGSSEKTTMMSEFLREHGIYAGAIRPPTVPRNTARIRLTITAAHTEEDIVLLTETIREAEKHL
jgi:8-amino-7-oxononanoate synthase